MEKKKLRITCTLQGPEIKPNGVTIQVLNVYAALKITEGYIPSSNQRKTPKLTAVSTTQHGEVSKSAQRRIKCPIRKAIWCSHQISKDLN